MFRKLAIILASAAVASCGFDLTTPNPDLDGLPAGLEVSLELEPGEVAPADSFTARLTLTNTTSDTIKIITSSGCLAGLNVLRDGKRMPFRGSMLVCTAVIGTHAFAPGETKTRTWELSAALYAEHPEDVDGKPAPVGSYVVQAEFGTYPYNQAAGRRPVAEVALRVK